MIINWESFEYDQIFLPASSELLAENVNIALVHVEASSGLFSSDLFST